MWLAGIEFEIDRVGYRTLTYTVCDTWSSKLFIIPVEIVSVIMKSDLILLMM